MFQSLFHDILAFAEIKSIFWPSGMKYINIVWVERRNEPEVNDQWWHSHSVHGGPWRRASGGRPSVFWKISMWGNPRALSAGMEAMAEQVRKDTGGKFNIKISCGSQLSSARGKPRWAEAECFRRRRHMQFLPSRGVVARNARRLLDACFADGLDVPDAAQVQRFSAS
jgi:hypothetical protein